MLIDTSPEIDFSTFPDSDGRPMAETEINLEQMIDLILSLRRELGPRGHHVGGNLLIYYDPAHGHNHCSPDVFVALDAGTARRRSWKVWEEGKFPEVVFEIVSPSTRHVDIGTKVTLYERLGADEYYIVDLEGEMNPAFRGYHRRGGALVRADNPTGLSIVSSVLGLELRLVEGWLRAIDPQSGRMLPTVEEEREDLLAELLTARALVTEAQARATREEEARRREGEARRAAEIRAAAAEARAVGAEAEVARLREALNRLKPDGTAEPPDPPNAQ